MESISNNNPWSPKDFGLYILLLICEVVVYGLVWMLLVFFGLNQSITSFLTGLSQGYAVFVLYLIQTAFLGLPLFILIRIKRIENVPDVLLLRKTPWYHLLVTPWVVYLISVTIMAVVMTYLTTNNIEVPGVTGEKTEIVKTFGLDRVGMIFAFVSAVLIAPIIEELVFRVMILRSLVRRMPMWLGVLLSSALFAAIHATPGVFIPLMLLGGVMALLTVYTKSIYPAIIFHMMNNAMAFVAEIIL